MTSRFDIFSATQEPFASAGDSATFLRAARDRLGVLNLSYRYRPDQLRETDASFVVPIDANWRLLGRWNYSLRDRSTLEGLAGVEWQDCCMAVRFLARNYIRDSSGDKDTAVLLEIELKGLGSLGRDTGDVLEHDILGYSR